MKHGLYALCGRQLGEAERRAFDAALPAGTATLPPADAGLLIAWHGSGHAAVLDDVTVAWSGRPRRGGEQLAPEALADWLRGIHASGDYGQLAELSGSFNVAWHAGDSGQLVIATDRFGAQPVYHASAGAVTAFGPGARFVSGLTEAGTIRPQALFDYCYFHVLPVPYTMYDNVQRVLPAHILEVQDGRQVARSWWRPRFSGESASAAPPEAAAEFERLIGDAVAADAGGAGAFLSGGIDSSTVVGKLQAASTDPVTAFSIGFDAEGYDEMEFAAQAARHYGAKHRSYYVTPADVGKAIEAIAGGYSEPFGNSSAVAVYHCALLAREHGFTRLLAGDGGDELFGGNERYARQRVFELYHRVPWFPLRRQLERAITAREWPAALGLFNKARSYIEQAARPEPDRFITYNHLDYYGIETIFTPAFLEQVDVDHPRQIYQAAYQGVEAETSLNRHLGMDYRITLTDNDLPKVTGMCEAAGCAVDFPWLDSAVVDFAGRLPAREKVRGGQLRYFVKNALADFLPDATLNKSKHGFGLPIGPWLTGDAALHELARGSLEALVRRGILRQPFAARLLEQDLVAHGAYFGQFVWVLMILEQWIGRNEDGLAY